MIQLTFIQFNLIINKIPFLSSLKKKKKKESNSFERVLSNENRKRKLKY